MIKRDVAIRIAKETGYAQEDVLAIVQKLLDYVTEALTRGEHVEFRDFGVFDVVLRKSRIGRNPNRPENTVVIPPRKVVKFKPGKKMRQMLLKNQTPPT